jgi:hypothetical protein
MKRCGVTNFLTEFLLFALATRKHMWIADWAFGIPPQAIGSKS